MELGDFNLAGCVLDLSLQNIDFLFMMNQRVLVPCCIQQFVFFVLRAFHFHFQTHSQFTTGSGCVHFFQALPFSFSFSPAPNPVWLSRLCSSFLAATCLHLI